MGESNHITLGEGGRAETRNPLEAHQAFFNEWLERASAALADKETTSLTVVLPPAPSEHDAWRRAVAGDLAREYTPKRMNIAAGTKGEALDTVLTFLRDAPGVTGHYVQAHD
ncbi:MAG: Rossmann fold domain-containing protein [Pseudomonadota bacterium]